MPTSILAASLTVVAGLVLLAAGVRRVPPGHVAVLIRRHRCRRLRVVGGLTCVVPGTGRPVLVALGRRQVAYASQWYALPGGQGVRLGMTLGLTVGDPCSLAAHDLAESAEARRTWLRPHVVSGIDWVDARIQDVLPPVVRDVVAELGSAGALAADRSRFWPLVRRRLADVLARHGLVVQEVWVRDLEVGVATVSTVQPDDRAVRSPSESTA